MAVGNFHKTLQTGEASQIPIEICSKPPLPYPRATDDAQSTRGFLVGPTLRRLLPVFVRGDKRVRA